MTGKIIFYNEDTQMGMIRAEDGKRYDFIAAEIRNAENAIMQGSEVDFILGEQDTPLDIYITAQMAVQMMNNTDHNLGTSMVPERQGMGTGSKVALTILAAMVGMAIIFIMIAYSMLSAVVDTAYKASGGH